LFSEKGGLMMRQWMLWSGLCLACLLNGSCAFHKTADQWNGLVGTSGEPVYLNSTTSVGFNFVMFLPFIGKTRIETMVEEATEEIREEGGNFVRVVQSTSENYWYAVPPITWIITPVVHTLVVEYQPQGQANRFQPASAIGPPRDFRPRRSYDWRGTDY
jgi:hypothetical protein